VALLAGTRSNLLERSSVKLALPLQVYSVQYPTADCKGHAVLNEHCMGVAGKWPRVATSRHNCSHRVSYINVFSLTLLA
jgi:hypothetical protein